MVPRQNEYYGLAFPARLVTTQSGLVSLTLFNLFLENVIRTWLDMTVEDKRVGHDGLGETVGWCLRIFYANDGMVGYIDPD